MELRTNGHLMLSQTEKGRLHCIEMDAEVDLRHSTLGGPARRCLK